MKKDSKGNKLRDKAEEVLSEHKSEMPPFDSFSELVHELQTHQIELELQNKELRSNQEQLEEAKLKYFNLYEFAPIGYFSLNKNEIIKDVNLAGAALLGAEKTELIDTAFIQYMNSKSRRTFYKHLNKIKNTNTGQSCELKFMKKDGTKLNAHLQTLPIQNDEKDIKEFRITATNITELINAENALKVSEEHYRQFFNNPLTGFALCEIITDNNGKPVDFQYLEINKTFENFTGLKREEVLNRKVTDVLPYSEVAEIIKIYGNVALTGKSTQFETTIPSLDKSYEILAFSPSKTYFIAFFTDITERKKIEKMLQNTLKESQKQQLEISALLDASKAVLEYNDFKEAARSIFDSLKNLIGANSGYVALLSEDGSENEILFLDSGGLPCNVDPELTMPIRGLRAECYKTGKTVYDNDFKNSKWAKLMPEGHVVLENVLFTPLNVKGKTKGLMGIANKSGDFNDHDASIASAFAELAAISLLNNYNYEKLEESEEKYRTLYETMTQGVIHQDSEGRIISFNPAAEKILGVNQYIVQGETSSYHSKAIHEDGTDFPAETHPSMIALKTGKDVRNVVMGSFNSQKEKYTWININATPLFKPGVKKPYQVYITFEDITETIKAQKLLKETLDELKRSNTELEQFAYVASHDLQEPLRMVSSFTQLLEKQYKDKLDETALEYINFAVDGAQRMQVLIKDLLTYSRVNTKGDEFEEVYLDKVLDEVFLNLELRIEANHAVITRESLPKICADYSQMVQLFQNLIGNALKYRSKETPQIHISTQKKDKYWLFSVEDNGIGIDPKYANRIFMIFKRLHTNEEYEGTGIGLAICKRIIERHNGKIWVESKPEKGSTFYFTIPMNLNNKLFTPKKI